MRSNKKELLDEENIPATALHRNLYELGVINSLLGGHKATLKGLTQILKDVLNSNTPITIIDIGCGGGDTLKAIAKWAKQQGIQVKLIGVDLKAEAIDYAKTNCAAYTNISFIQSDYKALPELAIHTDLYINALFCHHLSNKEILELLQFMHQHAQLGFLINDLHRHPLAYYSIKWLTKLFSKSYLVKNDAPLSVLRAFKQKELVELSILAQVPVKIQWNWAFRWTITKNG